MQLVHGANSVRARRSPARRSRGGSSPGLRNCAPAALPMHPGLGISPLSRAPPALPDRPPRAKARPLNLDHVHREVRRMACLRSRLGIARRRPGPLGVSRPTGVPAGDEDPMRRIRRFRLERASIVAKRESRFAACLILPGMPASKHDARRERNQPNAL
jgi:hypothetical protein